MSNKFKIRRFNEEGMNKVDEMSDRFDDLFTYVEREVTLIDDPGINARDRALVATKLQEAFMFARQALGCLPVYAEDA